MKILINTPNWRMPFSGGVANHYAGLYNYWTHEVKYNIVGSRDKSGLGILYMPYDVLRFIFILIIWKPDLVVLNPSLAHNAIRRDSIFLKISSLFKVKTTVFFHGFNLKYAESINPQYFKSLFSKANSFIVLAKKFQDYLVNWGITNPVYFATTKVDDILLEGHQSIERTGAISDILVLSRIEKEKGIYEAVDTYHLLKEKYSHLKLRVVGSGSELENLKSYVRDNQISDVTFTGVLTGKNLTQEYLNADMYLFPSYHEGMPTTVLEAMAFGLPIITRPVGGLVDFFTVGKMGYMIDSLNPHDFAKVIDELIQNPQMVQQMSQFNYDYAQKNFYASKVAKKMEMIFQNVVNKDSF